MKVTVLNPTNRNIGLKGNYFSKRSNTVLSNANMEQVININKHKQLHIKDIEDYDMNSLRVDELRLIAQILGYHVTGLYKYQIIKKLKGIEPELENKDEDEQEGEQ